MITGLRPARPAAPGHTSASALGVIDAVADVAVAVKPQVAFFEALGGDGITAMERVCAHARDPGLLVVVDGKRGDIPSTAEAYADAWLRPRGAAAAGDALTVNPYLGEDSLGRSSRLRRRLRHLRAPRTSNAGGADVQEPELATGDPVWERVAALVARWGEG